MTDLMKRLLDTQKQKTVILGPLQRMLLAQGDFDGGRRHDVIHPSELVKPDFCDLALFYRLSGWEIPKSQHAFQLEVIFSQGHGYHDKWQSWVWDLGTLDLPEVSLRGRYRCMGCMHGDWSKENLDDPWMASSPRACPKCGASRKHLQYGEVPIALPKYRIHGHSDGDLDLGPEVPLHRHPLLEIKSVGEGTIRYEAPKLIKKHTKRVVVNGEDEKTWTDWQAVWRDIRRPFKTHRKQGAIYSLAKERETMVFIYEFKPTGAVKEFTVENDFEIIAEELETALDVLYAVKKNKPPDCPHGGCKDCQSYEALRDGASDEEEARPQDREDPSAGESEEEAEEGGDRPPSRARRRSVRGSGGTRRRVGRRPDGGASREDRVGELPEREARRGRGDRGGRRGVLREGEGRGDAPSREPVPEGDDRDRAQGPRRVIRRRPRS